MQTETTQSGKILKFTVREYLIHMSVVITIVASAMGIWSRFQTMETNMTTTQTLQIEKDNKQDRALNEYKSSVDEKERIQDDRIDYVNKRIDRKFGQLKLEINKNK